MTVPSDPFDNILENLLRTGMRTTHNDAIDSAVRMIRLCGNQPIEEIVTSVLKLKVDAGEST